MSSEPRQRLYAEASKKDLLPWRSADSLTHCHLYWMPFDSVRESQKDWILQFLALLSGHLKDKLALRAETFLQFKVLANDAEAKELFMNQSLRLGPIIGLSRKPGAQPPPLPTMDQIRELQEGKKTFDFGEYMADYCYWFLNKDDSELRKLFLGTGGLTTLYIKPDPKVIVQPIKIPKFLREEPAMKKFMARFPVEHAHQWSHSLLDEFLEKSKELFGEGLKRDLTYEGLLFVIPLLSSSDFSHQPAADVKKWFEMFDVYVTESRADRGLLIASKHDLKAAIAAINDRLRESKIHYSEV